MSKDNSKYNRIVIIGNNGSGKSYLSEALSEITGLPLIHLDEKFWLPGWKMPPNDDWIKMQEEYVSEERWIIEGNHTGTMDIRFKAADLVIPLNINRLLCIASILKRCGKKRPDMPGYMNEKFDWGIIKLLGVTWRFSRDRLPKIMDLHKTYSHIPFMVIHGRNEVNHLIAEWRRK